jgi:site-specific recombinase XerD
MSKPPTSAVHGTAEPDLATNGASFARSLRAGNKSPATIKSYMEAVTQLDAFLAERGMPRVVAHVRREHVEAFQEDQLARLRPASAANRYRSLQQFFKWLIDEGEIKESPLAHVKAPAVPETPPPFLREGEIKKLLETTVGQEFDARRDRAIILMFVDTGIRRAEISGLKLEDIDWTQEVALVTGKGSRPRIVPLGRKVVQALDRYLRVRAKHAEARGPWLWLGRKGRLNDSGISQMLRRRAHEAGIGEIHAHMFRHGAAHELSAAGMGDSDLMRLMGWRSRTMLTRYGASAATERAIASHRKLSPADKL